MRKDQESWNCSGWRRESSGGSYNPQKYLRGRSQGDRARLAPLVLRDRIRGNGHNLKHRRLCLNTGKHFPTVRMTMQWHTSSRKATESVFLGTFQMAMLEYVTS